MDATARRPGTAGLVYAGVAWIYVAAIVVQVFLAGLGIFDEATWLATHRDFGYTALGIGTLVLVVTALVARPGRRELGLVGLLFLLYIVQTVLPFLRTSVPAVAALHPVNALLIFGLGVHLARRATARVRAIG